MQHNVFSKINDILSEWNPLEVPTFLAKEEYKDCINRIFQQGSDYQKIKAELILILTSDLGMLYDENNVLQRNEVEKISIQISNLLNS